MKGERSSSGNRLFEKLCSKIFGRHRSKKCVEKGQVESSFTATCDRRVGVT